MTNHFSDKQLINYVNHSLTDTQRETIDLHLNTCQDCRARLVEQETLHRRIHYSIMDRRRQMGPSAEMTFAAIAPKLKRSRRIVIFVKHSNQLLYGAATLAILIILGVGLITFLGGSGTPSALPSPTRAEFVLEFDGGPDRLRIPFSIDIDQQGNLYVANRMSNFRIHKFDRDGKPLTEWGTFGRGDGQFYFSSLHHGLAADGQGNVYVTDNDGRQIQKFDSNGQFLTKWGYFQKVGREINVPHDVAMDAQGNIYVIDCRSNVPFLVLKFDSNGQFLTKWEISESEWTGDGPSIHIAVDGESNVYVSNDRAHHIQKFDSDGNFLGIIGGPGSGDGQFDTPSGVAVDGQGNLYVADMENNRVQKFDSNGQFLFKWGSEGVGEGEFKRPIDVTVDAQGNVYVVDMDNNRIQMFRQM